MDIAQKLLTEFPPQPVFHYTSLRGLHGIVHEKKIWATNVLYVNDSTEVQYAIDVARKEIGQRKNSTSFELRHLEAIRVGLTSLSESEFKSEIYISSFSLFGDQLSQWRGYCPDGNGFSIGFDFSKLGEQMKKQYFRSAKCIYDRSDQAKILQAFLAEALTKLQAGCPLYEIQLSFLAIAPVLKDPKFSEEQEWRLISLPLVFDEVKYRCGKSMLIPYYEFELDPLSFKKIYIQQTPCQDLSKLSLRYLLWSENIDGCDIEISGIPYRS
jgi:hypothetical protein